MRAFIAVDLTSEIQKAIGDIQAALGRFLASIRWVKPESIHVTLKFLGEISETQQKQIESVCSERQGGLSPFEISVTGIGFFPNVRAPRVVWLGINQGKAELETLAAFVEESCRSVGFPAEARPFSPHVTIGRVKSLPHIRTFQEAAAPFTHAECGLTPVHQFFLYESQLARGGSIYTKRATFELE